MKANYLILIVTLLLTGCSSVKRSQNMLARGEYDRAIELAVKKIEKHSVTEKSEAQKLVLESAYRKALEQDQRQLAKLLTEDNPALSRDIYYVYLDLEARQNVVRPLLPLYSHQENRTLSFDMTDYTQAVVDAKKALVTYLYQEANSYFEQESVADFRTAYNIYCEIEELSPNYKDTRQLREQARFAGTDFVQVSLVNQSGAFLPYQLEQSLLDINTYGLDTFWTEFHSDVDPNITYNYGVTLYLRDLFVSPEQLSEQQFRRAKQVVDGYETRVDRDGNVVRDSLGNPIQDEKIITVRARVTHVFQQKMARVGGEVRYDDLQQNRSLGFHPLGTEFLFENNFAEFRGDERALNERDRVLLRNRFVQFPTDADMLLEAGTLLKEQLRERLREQAF